MKDQVLSIEQMQELIDMGIDTSNASMCWIKHEGWNAHLSQWRLYKNHIKEDLEDIDTTITPTFTLQDIVEMLPNSIECEGKTYWFTVFINGLNQKMIGYRDPELWALEFNINGAFDILKWCKKNNHI